MTESPAFGVRFFTQVLAALLSAHLLSAQTSPHRTAEALFEDDNWVAACKAAQEQPLPTEAARFAAQAESGASPVKPDCDEQQLYYGFGHSPRYHQALLCAYLHWTGAGHSFLTGAGTLSMLYANGDAVSRDYGLAIRFACESANEGGQNTDLRLGRLEALRDGKLPAGTRFDVCDEQISGAMASYCPSIEVKHADASRARKLALLNARLPVRAQREFRKLQAAETAFEEARARGEYVGGGGLASGLQRACSNSTKARCASSSSSTSSDSPRVSSRKRPRRIGNGRERHCKQLPKPRQASPLTLRRGPGIRRRHRSQRLSAPGKPCSSSGCALSRSLIPLFRPIGPPPSCSACASTNSGKQHHPASRYRKALKWLTSK